MRKTVLFLHAALLAAGPALAQADGQAPAAPKSAWQSLGTSQSGFAISWDSARIERSEDVVRILLRTERPSPEPDSVAFAISRIEIRCASGTGRVTETVNYMTDGSRGNADTEVTPFETIPPASMLAPVQRAVC